MRLFTSHFKQTMTDTTPKIGSKYLNKSFIMRSGPFRFETLKQSKCH